MAASIRKQLKEGLLKSRMLADKLQSKKVAILDIEELSFIPHFLPIYNELIKRTDRISFYIATNYPADSAFEEFGIEKEWRFPVTLSRKLDRADVFISAHIYGVGHPGSYRIHINHNQPVKYMSYQKNDFINFDAHFLTSPLHREQTENTIAEYGLEGQRIDLFDIGYCKSDKLLRGEYRREQVLNDLRLSSEKKTILYAPSWDEGLSLRSFGKEVIRELLKIENVNVIVKLHPISYSPPTGPNYEFYTGGINWELELAEFERHSNFTHVPVSNIDPLLAAADVMVTDLSSVALEFIMLDKPVVYIDCPEFFEKTLAKVYSGFGNTTADFVKNDPRANAGRHTGIVAGTIGDLNSAITRALSNPDEMSQHRRKLAEKLAYNPGHASGKAAETLLKILKIS